MHIILGATGHIGSTVVDKLLEKKEEVIAITHNPNNVKQLEEKGAQVEVVNVLDTDKLSHVFNLGRRLFLLNPPGNPAKNSYLEERHTLRSILQALEDSAIKRVVAESTYGAQDGRGIGDLGILYEMEQELKNLFIPHNIVRGAYYMSNWNYSVKSAQEEGVVYSLYPADFRLPMVAPQDIGNIVADLMLSTESPVAPHYVEGPEEYVISDVAVAFAEHLRLPVKIVTIPEDQWLDFLMKSGFSKESALSMAAMTKVTLEQGAERPKTPYRGKTTLNEYIGRLVSERVNLGLSLSNSF